MKLWVRAEESLRAELLAKLGDKVTEFVFDTDYPLAEEQFDLAIDLLADQDLSEERKEFYRCYDGVLLLNTVRKSLAELFESPCKHFGINGLPYFLGLSKWELSAGKNADKEKLLLVLSSLAIESLMVADRVGMITPRVVFMIINEAYYTVQEGTADREAIDQAMKLGTNYPFGPFEWANKIGIKNVYEVLDALYLDTRDERYKICPLLKKEYLLMEPLAIAK